jgi:transcriptional regulator with XRE-family HTH domain
VDQKQKRARNAKLAKRFGANLRAARLRKGVSQSDLAGICDVAVSQISRIERGTLNTSTWMVFLIADALDIQANELFE